MYPERNNQAVESMARALMSRQYILALFRLGKVLKLGIVMIY